MVKLLPKNCTIPFTLLLGLFFWIVDAFIDTFVFEPHTLFIDNIISPEPIELWKRTLVILLLITFSMYVRKTLKREQQLIDNLEMHQAELENTVQRRTKQLEKLATTDDLTDTLNRRRFYELLKDDTERYKRHGTELSLLLIDIDHFKKVNDNFGHQTGDLVLQNFATLINEQLRKLDHFARIGGEEFAVILPGNDLEQAFSVAEKIRNTINKYDFPSVEKLTASIGIADIQKDEESTDLYRRADAALYAAKENGRDCCRVSNPVKTNIVAVKSR